MKTSVCGFGWTFRVALLVLAAVACLGGTSGAVWAQDKFCIPPHQGLPWHGGLPPTTDGYVGRVEGISLSGDPIEQGWVRSGLFSYGYGGTSAWMELRGVKHNSQPYVYFSFVVQFDEAFDDNDAISVVLDPGWTPGAANFSANARRVDIYPVEDGAGAPGAAGSGPYLIRTERNPRNVDWSKFQGGSWSDMTAAPTGYEIKVRSWEVAASDKGWSVEIKLPDTIAAGGAEWINLGASFGFYTNVVKLCGQQSCQQDTVPIRSFPSNQFTFPRTNYTPNTPGFRAITGRFPTMKSAFNTVQAAWLGEVSIGATSSACSGVRFAGGPSGIGVLGAGGGLGTNIDATATNTLVARLMNDGTASDGKGIRAEYRIANWGIGGGPGTWDKIPARPTADLPAGPLNEAKPNANASTRVDVPAGGPSDIWMQTQVLLSDNYCNPLTSPTPCPPGSRDAHSCIWVVLDSNQHAYIAEASVRRNFNIIKLSSQRRQAEISAKGWEGPAGPLGTQEFYLTTHRRFLVHPGRVGSIKEIQVPKGILAAQLTAPDERLRSADLIPPLELELLKTPGLGREPLWNFIWMVNGSRATPMTLTIGQTTYRLYEPAGTFGTVGQHFGTVERFVDGLSVGPLLEQQFKSLSAEGSYRARIPDGQTLRVEATVGALAPGEDSPLQPPCTCMQQLTGKCPKVVGSAPSGRTDNRILLAIGLAVVGAFTFRRSWDSKRKDRDRETNPNT